MFESDPSDDSGLKGEVWTQEGLYLQVYDEIGFFHEGVLSKLLFFSRSAYNPSCTVLI